MTEIFNTNDEAAEDVIEEETSVEAGDQDTETGEDSASESDAAGEGAAEEEGAEDPDQDEEPPTRKPRTNADWVALRRKQKLEKARAAQGAEGEDHDDEDDVDEEDAKIIDKVLAKRLAPYERQQELAELKTEIDDFVSKNPDFKPYAAKALKWGQHPSYKELPIKQLMFAAAGDKLMKIGAIRAKNSAVKTQKTKTGAGTAGNGVTGKSVADMSDEEFAQEVENVKLGR